MERFVDLLSLEIVVLLFKITVATIINRKPTKTKPRKENLPIKHNLKKEETKLMNHSIWIKRKSQKKFFSQILTETETWWHIAKAFQAFQKARRCFFLPVGVEAGCPSFVPVLILQAVGFLCFYCRQNPPRCQYHFVVFFRFLTRVIFEERVVKTIANIGKVEDVR